jgi:hypothetical protein
MMFKIDSLSNENFVCIFFCFIFLLFRPR